MLEIKGLSQTLTDEKWECMVMWRKKMFEFVRNRNESVFLNGPDKKMIALSFDDGPDLTVTPGIVKLLKERNVPGNFFFTGINVEKHPQVVLNTYQNGNLILSHSYKHDDMTSLDNDEIYMDIKKTEAAIEKVIGLKPAILRTPYGETDSKVLSIATQAGYKVVLWSLDTLDWTQKHDVNMIAQNVISNVRNGDIILMHSLEDFTSNVSALSLIIDELKRQSFEFVNLETLLGIKAYQ
ncbi:polysaccharide deacetylase family protein [Paenibacillus sp. L3-i20]|uniref:polysaccharide deacetylase family protein n=1 Tax=Paenibacillus sp. L3-i20 TaxID=2905833 RepID=UPI001EDE4421|nr:polysaccharide deacetylase family protein [Paenibacillus sp. L3-i20]